MFTDAQTASDTSTAALTRNKISTEILVTAISLTLGKAGWSYGYVSALDRKGRTICIVDAHGYGMRFVVRADQILTAFLELERAIHEPAVSLVLKS